jgi:hypothetical protein
MRYRVGGFLLGIVQATPSHSLHSYKYRAQNDIYNSVAAGFLAGGILARNSGPRAALGGGLAFAAFSAAIDAFMRREPAE